MRFYTKTHKHYCGIDLHAKKMFVCILDAEGTMVLHRNIATSPEDFLKTIVFDTTFQSKLHSYLVIISRPKRLKNQSK